MLHRLFTGTLAALLLASSLHAFGAGRDVLMHHYDLTRSGWNNQETQLRSDTVSSSTFGKLWYTQMDGQVYNAPLIVSDLTVDGKTRNVLYAGTENDSVFALDADTGEQIWKTTVGKSVTQSQFLDACPNVNPLHGITGTPVIDRATNTLYTVALVYENLAQKYNVYALDLATGQVKTGWPVTISGKYKNRVFQASTLTQRAGLALYNGVIYVPFSSRCDAIEWHGWVAGIPVTDPKTPRMFSTAPTGYGSGVWGVSGASFDSDGNMYIVTGNGDFDLNTNGDSAGESILRLKPTDTALTFSKDTKDYYTPANYNDLNNSDLDLGGSSPILLPEHKGSLTPHLLVTSGKDGVVYLVDRDTMGGVGKEVDKVRANSLQDFSVFRSTCSYYQNAAGDIFVFATPEPYGGLTSTTSIRGVACYKLTIDPDTKKSKLTFQWTNAKKMLFPASSVVTSNGGKDSIVWVVDTNKNDQHHDQGGSGILYGFDAESGKELYNSNQISAIQGQKKVIRDNMGQTRKFTGPTAANGRVYCSGGDPNKATSYGVTAYGLFPQQGDVNGDGAINIADATLALQAAVGLVNLTAIQLASADLDASGSVDIKDATKILQKAVGL